MFPGCQVFGKSSIYVYGSVSYHLHPRCIVPGRMKHQSKHTNASLGKCIHSNSWGLQVCFLLGRTGCSAGIFSV